MELKRESSSVYVTLGFAGIALVAAMVVGVAVLKRRNGRHPLHQVNNERGYMKMQKALTLGVASRVKKLLEF